MEGAASRCDCEMGMEHIVSVQAGSHGWMRECVTTAECCGWMHCTWYRDVH